MLPGMNRDRLSRAFGAYQRRRMARASGATLGGFLAHALRQRALRALAAPLILARRRPGRGGAFGRALARAWLWCWRSEGLRFDRQELREDPFSCWEREAPRDLALMARCGALLWSDPAPFACSGAPAPLLALCLLNCAQLPGLGCDESDPGDWIEALGALLDSVEPQEREAVWSGAFMSGPLSALPEPLRYRSHPSSQPREEPNLTHFLLCALARAPERLRDRSEQASRLITQALSRVAPLRPPGACWAPCSSLALIAAESIDERGEALSFLASIPQAREALLNSPALPGAARACAAARAFQERWALEALRCGPPARARSL